MPHQEQDVAWAEGWVALTDLQRERVKFLRWLVSRGAVTEFPATEQTEKTEQSREEPC